MKNELIGGLAILFSVLVFYLVIPPLRATLKFQKNALTAKGEVIEMKSRSVKTGLAYAPVIRYQTHEGQEQVFTEKNYELEPKFGVGDEVGVKYDPKDASNARLDNDAAMFTPFLLFLALAICAFIGGAYVFLKKPW